MSEIKPRIIISFQDGGDPIITTDINIIKTLRIKSDDKYRFIHQIGIGTIVTLPDSYKAEVISISTNYYDMEYKNEGINPHGHGALHPYNFEVIYKLRRIV